MRFNTRLTGLAAVLAVAGTVHAQAPQPQSPSSAEKPSVDFATVDRDTNGQLSREESRSIAALEGAFDSLDSNGDHTLSPKEFANWSQAGNPKAVPRDPATAPGGSAGAQHLPQRN